MVELMSVYHDDPRVISNGFKNPQDIILTCPDCGSCDLDKIEHFDSNRTNYYSKTPVKENLYGNDPEDEHDLKESYEQKHGHVPVERQNHFFCNNCLDYEMRQEYEYDSFDNSVPIFPFNELKRINKNDIQTVVKTNPYEGLFD